MVSTDLQILHEIPLQKSVRLLLLQASRGRYLNVLDFIGNYEKAGEIPRFLGGEPLHGGENPEREPEYPDDCIVDFDMRLIDLFQTLERKSRTIRETIQAEYFRVKDLLGKVPTRIDLFTHMEDEIYGICMRTAKENPFRRYLE